MEPHKKVSSGFSWMYLPAFIIALGIAGFGAYLGFRQGYWPILAVGCAALAGVLAAWPIGVNLHDARQCDARYQEELLTTLTDRLQQVSVMLNLISEQQLLSDRAKAVAFREKDADALRRAIREEIVKQNYDGALILANNMESAFGYVEEADRFRDEIDLKRQDQARKQIHVVIASIDRYTKAEQWSQAYREADRLRQFFPTDPQVSGLHQEIDTRRETQKKQLLDSWNDAVARHDVDGSIEILKKLDTYLSPNEAQSLQEKARGVFKEKINILRDQFSQAVHDQKWPEAIRIGEVIARDFPNTRLAQEVRDTMPTLKQRASDLAAAPA